MIPEIAGNMGTFVIWYEDDVIIVQNRIDMISKGIFLMIIGAIIAVIAYRILENIKLNSIKNVVEKTTKKPFKGLFGKILGIIGVLMFYLGVLMLILRFAISR